jgi:two-component system, sensor histidine kinase and response regulator
VRAVRIEGDRRVLLAEDNPVNQKVARIVLEKLGLEVEVVNNGRDAVEAWQKGKYDLILMDCQMPQLDGYAATRRIREEEELQGRHIPIVALTAHAMKGDDIKCLEAGMDDYLTKPLDRALLIACLEKHFGKLAAAEVAPAADAQANTVAHAAAPVDWSALLQSTDGDEEMARELIELFIASGDETLAAIATALGKSDYAAVGAQAHSLKGASASLRAKPAATAAARLEAAARAGDGGKVVELAAEVHSEVSRTIAYLRKRVRVA